MQMKTQVQSSIYIQAGGLKGREEIHRYYIGASIAVTQGENSQDAQPLIPWNTTIRRKHGRKKEPAKEIKAAASEGGNH